MATQNVTACSHDGNTITGVTSIQISGSRNVTPIHVDGDAFNSCAVAGPGARSVVVTSVDFAQLQAMEGATAGTLAATLAGHSGGSNVSVSLVNSVPHSFSMNQTAPGEPASASLTFTGKSADGSTDSLSIS